MSVKRAGVNVFLLAAAAGLLLGAGAAPSAKQQILNVVLVELDIAPDAKISDPIVNDWAYWTASAGTLIGTLESRLGYARAGQGIVKKSGATLFAVRAVAKGLADTEGLLPLAKKLDRICETTRRSSFLVVWLRREQSVLVAVHDLREVKASTAFAMLASLESGLNSETRTFGALESPYVAPPSVLIRGAASPLSNARSPELDDLLDQSDCSGPLLHCLRGASVQLIVDSVVRPLAEATPAGAAFVAMRPAADGVRQSVLNVGDSLKIDFGPVQFEPGRMLHGFDRWTTKLANAWYKNPGNPGGILLEPELTVVVDKSGLAGALASKAVTAVQGKAGAEFVHEGKKYIAVKTPGTANLFWVPAGRFRLNHPDIRMKAEGHGVVQLVRYYDSSVLQASPLGPGWSVQPFSLEVSERVTVGEGKALVAVKPVLVDRRAGVRLAYRLEERQGAAKTPSGSPVAVYRKVSSSLQPDLAVRADGGYLAKFAHGLQVALDKNGRIQWIGSDEADRVAYIFDGERLKEIRGPENRRISLTYEKDGRLVGVKASTGKKVAYVLDDAGRLNSVTGSESGPRVFTYGTDGRLATIRRAKGDEAGPPTVANTYDDKGRMLTHRTPQGEWKFLYNDTIGRATVTGPDRKDVAYYYDGSQRLVAYGADKDKMTLLNYDVTGRILQVAMAEMLNDPSEGERPQFKVSKTVAPLPVARKEKKKGEDNGD
ncbi:MAG: hypothetical protein GWP08_15455 [Nitrospiraceae bacterium]|nr:hypothetical protein [Nitrospiraceae bacterium]